MGSALVDKKQAMALRLRCLTLRSLSSTSHCAALLSLISFSNRSCCRWPSSASRFRASSFRRSSCSARRFAAAESRDPRAEAGPRALPPRPPSSAPKSRWLRFLSRSSTAGLAGVGFEVEALRSLSRWMGVGEDAPLRACVDAPSLAALGLWDVRWRFGEEGSFVSSGRARLVVCGGCDDDGEAKGDGASGSTTAEARDLVVGSRSERRMLCVEPKQRLVMNLRMCHYGK